MMRIHFVTEKGRWVLRKLCEQFAQYLSEATIGIKPDKRADVNVFVNYALYQSVPTKTIGYFTHRENDKRLAARFDFVAQRVDWCIAMCGKTAAYLPAERTTIIQAWPEQHFHKSKLVLGVVGNEKKSGRKRFDLIPKIRKLVGVEVRVTGGKIPDEDMPAFYQDFDYLLVLGNNEGGPLPVMEALAMGKPVIAPDVGFCWKFPVLKYTTDRELLKLIQGLVIPVNGWRQAAQELEELCVKLCTKKDFGAKKEGAMKRWNVLAIAAACLAAVPLVIEALSRAWGRTLEEERRTRVFLFFCAATVVVVVIFRFWLQN